MYKNLRAEIVRLGLTNKEFAEKVGIKPSTFSTKIQGKVEFTLSEAMKIKNFVGSEMPIEYIFSSDGVLANGSC